ncbi:MAG: ATP-binding protein [Acidobacteriota bacterium]|nr:ATP-binding protein [Acidobacteriota bacterium]
MSEDIVTDEKETTVDDLRLFFELFDQMPQLGWTARPDGYIDYYNRGWYEYTGSTAEEMAGWGWQSVHHPAMLEAVKERWAASIATGNDFEMEFPLRRHDGAFRWFLTRVRPLRDSSGTILRWVGINTDVTMIRQLRETIDQERLNLRELFELAPAFMARVRGPAHIFEEANPAYMRLVGEHRNLIGLPVREALPEIEGQGFFELLDQVYATGKPFTGVEVRVMLRRGEVMEERFVDFVYQATKNAEGEIDGVFAHGTDVTAQVTARKRIEEQTVELRRASQVKDEFLATLSHELRTPMTAVLGWARLLRSGLSATETEAAIEAIEQAASAQAQLIEDVLDTSRITAGKLTLESRPVDLSNIARAAITALHPTATARKVEILSSLAPGLPPIAGDEGRLQQVIWNLVSNALKFTPRGGTVTVRVTHEGSMVRLTVQDTGIGIDPQFLAVIFEPFRQADSSTTRAHGGIGLGLSIVRTLVELHGGVVKAESEGRDRGATFTVELPVLESMPAAATATERGIDVRRSHAPAGDLPLLRDVTVLVVDDQDYTRDVVAAILRRVEATVHTASSVQEGLALLDQHAPDVVLCDIAMPERDGYDFVRTVRAQEGPASTMPVVALTAYSRPEDRIRALNAGFDEYLQKPIGPLELVETVRRLISKRR